MTLKVQRPSSSPASDAALRERVAFLRRDPAFARWADGGGVVRHDEVTQWRAFELAERLVRRGAASSASEVFCVLAAADRVANAGLWLVAHMSYARRVRLDGAPLGTEDFKPRPEGHMGGALNMVLAYTGYLAANALSGSTRSWLMGQGHCVAAIDAVNLIVGNTFPGPDAYAWTEEGLSRFVSDFYSYRVRADGSPASPLGSHVGPSTAGGVIEGGYLGFAELYYPHMPLPGESLVAFLSDGAFEEQRGGDWAARWWRMEDCGLVVPIMIANGRRIDQRTTLAQQGGVAWLRDHLRLNALDPFDIDGRDPAAYAWAVLEAEDRLTARGRDIAAGTSRYPVPLPYAVAEVPKGFGFAEAGTNLAHNLPLGEDPAHDPETRRLFNECAARLRVPSHELEAAAGVLNNHAASGRVRERDHPLSRRSVPPPALPEPAWKAPGEKASPMRAIDGTFCALVGANPGLRPRVGNPDEISSNQLEGTLRLLKHRVTSPEPGMPESVHGAVITALNEEAVCCAALANKGGLNLIATYEAFGVKMLGALRQELTFTRRLREAGRPPGWLSVPVLLTSHTWENGKNEQSHQDPTLCEALMGEMSDVSRVLFPADWNSAAAALRAAYATRGEIWTLVTPKRPLPVVFTPAQAEALARDGAARLRGGADAQLLLAAVGAYQLEQALRASDRLRERDVSHAVVYILEPGRFRAPRDKREETALAPELLRRDLFPASTAVRVFLSHTRPEALLGMLAPLSTGPGKTMFLGYINQGGTLNAAGMLFANRCTWAHALAAAHEMFGRAEEALLEPQERDAVEGRSADPLAALKL